MDLDIERRRGLLKVAIVCFNDTFFDRVRLLKKYYLSKGYDVTVISSDFSHRKKQRISALDGADTLIENSSLL